MVLRHVFFFFNISNTSKCLHQLICCCSCCPFLRSGENPLFQDLWKLCSKTAENATAGCRNFQESQDKRMNQEEKLWSCIQAKLWRLGNVWQTSKAVTPDKPLSWTIAACFTSSQDTKKEIIRALQYFRTKSDVLGLCSGKWATRAMPIFDDSSSSSATGGLIKHSPFLGAEPEGIWRALHMHWMTWMTWMLMQLIPKLPTWSNMVEHGHLTLLRSQDIPITFAPVPSATSPARSSEIQRDPARSSETWAYWVITKPTKFHRTSRQIFGHSLERPLHQPLSKALGECSSTCAKTNPCGIWPLECH